MIVAQWKNAGDYKGISPLLDRALDLMNKEFLERVGTSPTFIEGRDLYATLNVLETEPDDGLFYENHHKYLDIHVVVAGEERLDIASPEDLLPDEKRSKPENDFYAFSGNPREHQSIILRPGTFLVAWPSDAHRCKGQVNGASAVQKVVFKVRLM